jgi:SAM-dependent methyltransferase
MDQFTEFEHRGWERVAGKYESAWSSLTRLFIPHLLEAVKVAQGDRLLDVACGPGYVAESAHAMGAKTVGIDFSAEMIRLAKERNPQLEFREGDAQALDFPDNSFDIVVINFGVLHLSRPEQAMAEAARVLRPGGRLAFTVWAGPEHSPGAKLVEAAIRVHADMNVELPKGPDYFGFGDAELCRRILATAGFDPYSLVFNTVVEDWRVPTADFVFEAERDAGVRTAGLLAAQNKETLDAIRAEMATSLAPFATPNGYAIPYGAHVISAKAA